MNAMTYRVKKSDTRSPRDLSDANTVVAGIGAVLRETRTIETALAERVALLRATADAKLALLGARETALVQSLFVFAEARKTDLTRDAKTVVLGAGEFGWRMTPMKVVLTKDEQKLIRMLRRRKLARFVRVKAEIDKEALRKELPVIDGITYDQHDEFFVKPKPLVPNEKIKVVTRRID